VSFKYNRRLGKVRTAQSKSPQFRSGVHQFCQSSQCSTSTRSFCEEDADNRRTASIQRTEFVDILPVQYYYGLNRRSDGGETSHQRKPPPHQTLDSL